MEGTDELMSTVIMLDAISVNEPHIPAGTRKVGGYTTQVGNSAGIKWSAAQFANWLVKAGVVPINQDPAADTTPGVVDLENGAWTVAETVSHAKVLGPAYAGTYVDVANLPGFLKAWEAAGLGAGNLWLANWDLNQAEATALIGTKEGPLTIRAVQWASPSSNPNTIVPGGTATLKAAGIDISVADAAWFPAPAPKPAPPPVPALIKVPLTLQSADNGKTWKVA
jgi:hypothetical protein